MPLSRRSSVTDCHRQRAADLPYMRRAGSRTRRGMRLDSGRNALISPSRTDRVSRRTRPPASSGSAMFRAVAALTSECREERTPTRDGLLFFGAGTDRPDADGAARDGAGLARGVGCPGVDLGVRRSQDAPEPPAEDRGEEAEKRAEGERVPNAVQAEAGSPGEEVNEAVHADARENTARRGVAHQHENEQHEQVEESGEHAVPAGAISRHPAGDVTADQIRDENPDDDRDRGSNVVAPDVDACEDSRDRGRDERHRADRRNPSAQHRHPRGGGAYEDATHNHPPSKKSS